MPIDRYNQQFFMEHLYAGQLESVTLLKRKDGQQAGQYTVIRLFVCRWGKIFRAGEIIQTDETSKDRRTLHLQAAELRRNGVEYLNPADRFIDAENRYWEPEAPTGITVKLLQDHICVECVRIDPVPNPIKPVTLGPQVGEFC